MKKVDRYVDFHLQTRNLSTASTLDESVSLSTMGAVVLILSGVYLGRK